MPVRRELNAVGQARLEIGQKLPSDASSPLPDQPGDHELGIRIHRGPRPHISLIRPLLTLLDVPLLDPAEGPNLVALYPLGRDVPQLVVLAKRAHLAQVHQQLDDGVLGGELPSTRHRTIRARRSIDSWFIAINILERSSNVNRLSRLLPTLCGGLASYLLASFGG